jgi:AcrR family transcriptional regulator
MRERVVSLSAEPTPGRVEEPEPAAACERREEILAAATKIFAELGYSDAVTQSICDRLGVGKGTIYRYFPSKRELFLAAADRVMRLLGERVDAETAGATDDIDRVERGVRGFLGFFAEHPEYVELLIQERAQFKDRATPTYLKHRERNVQRWRAIYRGLIGEGRLRDIPPERISDVVSDLLYGTIFTTYFFIGRRKPLEEQVRDFLDILFYGILSDDERRRRGGDG